MRADKSHLHPVLTRSMRVHENQVGVSSWQGEKQDESKEKRKKGKDKGKTGTGNPGSEACLLPTLPVQVQPGQQQTDATEEKQKGGIKKKPSLKFEQLRN